MIYYSIKTLPTLACGRPPGLRG